MSGLIETLVLRKRTREADQNERARFLAEARGPSGAPGPAGERGPAPRHEWKGTALRFEHDDGTWGKFTELKGAPGTDGKDGSTIVISRGGSSGTDLADLEPGAPNNEPAGVAVMQGSTWVRLEWSAFIAMVSAAIAAGTGPN